MTAKEAISIVNKCAKQYDEILCNKKIAFLYRDGNNKSHALEVSFRANNFMHFTGITTKNSQKAVSFYRDALDQRLKESNIVFKDSYTTQLKLEILPKIMTLPYTARMVGDYIGPRIELITEKVTGTTSACLGVIKDRDEYIPNTILNEDIRHIVPYPPGKIFAIFRKGIHDTCYTEITYHSQNLLITKKCLPSDFSDFVAPELLTNGKTPE